MSQNLFQNSVSNSLQSELLSFHAQFEPLIKIFIDAFALIDAQGQVVKYNALFPTFVGQKSAYLKKQPNIASLLQTPHQQDFWHDLLLRRAPIRLDEVTFQTSGISGDDSSVDLAAPETREAIVSYLPYAPSGNTLGGAILLRDVTAESKLQGKYAEKSIQSVTDPLTGLFTRRYFDDRWSQITQPTVLLFDLDRFKSINDTFGHQAGDYVLRETSKILKSNSRKSDMICRFGGEELVILVDGVMDHTSALHMAEKFRRSIAEHVFLHAGEHIPVTTSIGVTRLIHTGEGAAEVMARADRCLYAAKHAGRNRVVTDWDDRGPQAVLKNE